MLTSMGTMTATLSFFSGSSRNDVSMLSEAQKAEVLERMRFIEQFLVNGRSTEEIIRRVVKVFGISRRQAFRDLAKVLAAWKKVGEKDRPVNFWRAVVQRDYLYRLALAGQDTSVALSILQDIARLQGLYPARRLQPKATAVPPS
jgi:hypothetical protein